MSESQRPSLWGGPSGDAFAQMVVSRLAQDGWRACADVRPVHPGAYLVDVDVDEGVGVLFEVVDWIEGARIMDPNGEDVEVPVASEYIALRNGGLPAGDALERARSFRP